MKMPRLISRRLFTTGLASCLGGTRGGLAAEAAAGKKGWGGADAELHKLFKVHWHYNWMPRGTSTQEVEFVPLIKGTPALNQAQVIVETPGVKHLLGFNEPERESQGNVSVSEALDLWPKLEAIAEKAGLRLGSPATSSDKPGMDWFEAFMEQAKRRKLRMDFVALHWYRGRDASAFESFVTAISRSHRLPVWVTEFNGWSGGEEENHEFLKGTLRFMERSRIVERYAYFNPPKGAPHSLLAADGSLTRMGKLYSET
ncbi:MAG TPA: glycosyl hydrolase [Prosthecobacter sp.]|nr:glycosyl hydrolase [Prosthecobacter sp.]HRK15958.1 glycosyl hydrolase [Prosthecobacter sp.]